MWACFFSSPGLQLYHCVVVVAVGRLRGPGVHDGQGDLRRQALAVTKVARGDLVAPLAHLSPGGPVVLAAIAGSSGPRCSQDPQILLIRRSSVRCRMMCCLCLAPRLDGPPASSFGSANSALLERARQVCLFGVCCQTMPGQQR